MKLEKMGSDGWLGLDAVWFAKQPLAPECSYSY